MRSVESCPHRGPADASGSAACALALRTAGAPAGHPAGRVGLDACRACCAHPVPADGRLNPVVASAVGRLADAARGGAPWCDAERAEALRAWARGQLAVVRPTRAAAAAAVILVCRDDARSLDEAIASVLGQTAGPLEVVVALERGGSAASPVVGRAVRVVLIEPGDGFRAAAFRTGLEVTKAEVVGFLDAGDRWPPDYLERGLRPFEDPRVGIVYPDVESARDGRRRISPEFDGLRLDRADDIPPGALVRRAAAAIADATREPWPATPRPHWLAWRRIADAGWTAVKMPAAYRERPQPVHADGPDYFDRAALGAAEVTIFTPLSGRTRLWPDYRGWLESQHWPRGQCRLFLLDTSRDPRFGRAVREFLADCDYPDTRYAAAAVGEPGLADRPRRDHSGAVNLACARIYNRLAREAVTPYVLVVEDDIVPPAGVVERLLRAMDETTAAVAAPYRSRFHGGYLAWDDGEGRLPGGAGSQAIGGAGFGCLLLRRAALAAETFRHGDDLDEPLDFDHAFCRRRRLEGWTIRIDWSQECLHRDSDDP